MYNYLESRPSEQTLPEACQYNSDFIDGVIDNDVPDEEIKDHYVAVLKIAPGGQVKTGHVKSSKLGGGGGAGLKAYDVADVITFSDGAMFTIVDGALKNKDVVIINIKATDNEIRSFVKISTDNAGVMTFSQLYDGERGATDNFVVIDTNTSQGIYHEKPVGYIEAIQLDVGTDLNTYDFMSYPHGTWFRGKDLLGVPAEITESAEVMIQLVKYGDNNRFAIELYHTGLYEGNTGVFINFHYADKFEGWKAMTSSGGGGVQKIVISFDNVAPTNDGKSIDTDDMSPSLIPLTGKDLLFAKYDIVERQTKKHYRGNLTIFSDFIDTDIINESYDTSIYGFVSNPTKTSAKLTQFKLSNGKMFKQFIYRTEQPLDRNVDVKIVFYYM